MKIFNIFMKNLRVVTRNWTYFIVLFIFPFFLILTSSILLNSSNLANIKIGMVNEYPGFYLDTSGVGNTINYDSLDECMYYLTNYRVSVCIHVKNIDNKPNIDVYLDNTRRLIELYVRQTILDRVFREQAKNIETTSDFIDSRMSTYSTSLDQTYNEVLEVEKELENEEILLYKYRENLTRMRTKFDQTYFQIKNMQPQIKNIKNDLDNRQNDVQTQINSIKNEINNIENNLIKAKNYINGKIPANDYLYFSSLIDPSIQSLQNIENSLNNIQSSYNNQEIINLLNNVDEMIYKLDEVRDTLDNVDQDLNDAIKRMSNAKNRVSSFKNKIKEMQTEIENFQSGNNNGGIGLNFLKAFMATDNLVLVAFPFVITVIITFSSLVLSNRFILNQVNKPSYQREIISPTKDVSFIVSDYLINLFFVSIQVFVLVLIGFVWFGIPIYKLPAFLISILLASSSFIFIGISIGYLIKSESLSTLFTIFLVMFLMIFSDMLVYSVLLPTFLKFLINLSPFVILNSILNDTIIVGKGMGKLVLPIFRLCILVISSFLIAYLSKKASRENAI